MTAPIAALIVGASPILGGGLLGWLALRVIGGRSLAREHLHLAYPVGSGILTLALFLVSWAGIPLHLWSVGATALTLAIVMSLRLWMRRDRPNADATEEGVPDGHGSRSIRMVLTLAIGALVLVAMALSVGRSYSVWDGMAIWSVKGYGIAREGTIWAAEEWGAHGLSYPLNVPLQISIFEMLDGDWLPHSKLIFPLYYLSLSVGLLAFLRRRLSITLAGLASLLIASAPIVFEQSTNGYANLAFSTYLVLGLLTMADNGWRPGPGREVTAGVLLGLAVWTRPEGYMLVPVSALCTWLACRFSGSRSPRLAMWASPLLLLGLPWVIFSAAAGTQGIAGDAMGAVWNQWRQSSFRLGDVYAIIRYLGWQALRLEFWGVSAPLLGLALVFVAGRFRRGALLLALPFLTAAASIFLAVFSYYYLAGAVSDLRYLLSTSVERVAMPGMILLLTGVATLLSEVEVAPNVAINAEQPPSSRAGPLTAELN